MTILEHFSDHKCFVPANADEYFALQLAKRLGDEDNVHRFVGYARRYSHEQLLELYWNALRDSGKDAAAHFHSSFTKSEP